MMVEQVQGAAKTSGKTQPDLGVGKLGQSTWHLCCLGVHRGDPCQVVRWRKDQGEGNYVWDQLKYMVMLEKEAGSDQSRQSPDGHVHKLSSSLTMRVSSGKFYEQALHNSPGRGRRCTSWPHSTLVAKASEESCRKNKRSDCGYWNLVCWPCPLTMGGTCIQHSRRYLGSSKGPVLHSHVMATSLITGLSKDQYSCASFPF